jgi:hypothetical protein
MIGSLFRSLSQTSLIVSGCLALLLAMILSTTQGRAFPDCLNLSPSPNQFNPTDHPDCSKDPLDLSNDKAVRNGEALLDITPQEIRFIGCEPAPFVTFPAVGLNSKFTIYYPTGIQLAHDKYVAPLLHEMGHVFQLKQAGSYKKLKASLDDSIERIELGADFIAGLGANRLDLEPNTFLINLNLVGGYSKGAQDHGRPEDRAAAFRNGYFYQEKQFTIADSYADFQDNRFAQIKHQ